MWLGTQSVGADGHLQVGGCDTVALAEQFGTPLYVLDEWAFRARCRAYRQAFCTRKPDTRIAYAGKALLTVAVCQMVAEEGLELDVASGGELYTALKAGFPPERIHLHGVYKTESELREALAARVGTIVLDNFDEIERLRGLMSANDSVSVMVRVAPDVTAETHPLIQTGQLDSKFGFHWHNREALRAVEAVLADTRLRLEGFHCHIGSQIGDLEAFRAATRAMVSFAQSVRQRLGYWAPLLNVGGGLAVRYTPDDPQLTPDVLAEAIVGTLRQACAHEGYPEPVLMIEPGRSLIAEAGLTLYRVGAVKHVSHGRSDLPETYLIVDGGVSDNPRPTMYGARYTAVNAMRADPTLPRRPYRILGKHCETDPIIDWAELPETRVGDLIAVLTTGAYAYSMSSNYNRYPRPAMVAVREGQARLIVRRETYDQLVQNDLPLSGIL